MNREEEDQVEVSPSPMRPARLHPFKALRLAPGRVADPATARALSRPYRGASHRISDWKRAGRIEEDSEAALYLHEYTSGGITIRGLVGTLELTSRATTLANSAVLPHEAIHADQAGDLAERMQELGINPAPILLAHRGNEGSRQLINELIDTPPDLEITDRSHQHHRQWAVRGQADQDTLNAGLANSSLLIADGHHRYAAYLRLQANHPGTGWDHGLAMVVDQDDTPLFLGAVHRVFRGITLDVLADAASEVRCRVAVLEERAAVASLAPNTWVATDGCRWLSVRTSTARGHLSSVEDLHDLVLPIAEARHRVETTYRHSVEAALQDLSRPGVAVLLPAPDFDLLDRTLHQGRLLPEKATSFQPKPNVGVLMRQVERS